MKEIVTEILQRLGFTTNYMALCNKYQNLDNGMKVQRTDIEPLIKQHEAGFKFFTSEKLFEKIYVIGDYKIHFAITYKGGLITPMYNFVTNEKNVFRGGLGTLATIVDPEFESKVKYRTPIATSIDDLKVILDFSFGLHKGLMIALEQSKDRFPPST